MHGGGKAGASGFSATEVLQYTKYFQLVPAQGLRVAYDNMVGSFEAILREVRVTHEMSMSAIVMWTRALRNQSRMSGGCCERIAAEQSGNCSMERPVSCMWSSTVLSYWPQFRHICRSWDVPQEGTLAVHPVDPPQDILKLPVLIYRECMDF